jgi:cell division protein FtsQ
MSRKTKTVLIVVVLFSIIIGATSYVLFKPYYLVVNFINVTGNSYLTTSEVIDGAGIKNGQSLVLTSISDIEKLLSEMAWVSEAKVTKVWPDGISMTITERKPLLALSYHGGFVIIDDKGIVLDIKSNFSEVNLPIISGYIPDSVSVGRLIMGEELWSQVTNITDYLPISIILQLSELSWYGYNVRMYLNNGLEIFIGDIREFDPEKLLLLPEVIDNINDIKEGYLDLSGIYTVFRRFN